jgi:hypothetical protein
MPTREQISAGIIGRGPTGDFGTWRKLEPDEAIKSGDMVVVTTHMRGETIVERDMRVRNARSATDVDALVSSATAAWHAENGDLRVAVAFGEPGNPPILTPDGIIAPATPRSATESPAHADGAVSGPRTADGEGGQIQSGLDLLPGLREAKAYAALAAAIAEAGNAPIGAAWMEEFTERLSHRIREIEEANAASRS